MSESTKGSAGVAGRPLAIGFLGDLNSPNTKAWLEALSRQPGVEIRPGPVFESFGRKMRPGRLARDVARLFAWRKTARPDLLIGYRTTSYGFVAALTRIRPLVLAAQGETDVWPPGNLRTALKEHTARFAIRSADLLHAWGSHMAEDLVRLGARREQILVMPKGVDVRLFCPAETPRAEGELVVATTRSLYPEYGVETLLCGVALALKDGVPVRIVIAGDGSERARLEALAVTLDLGEKAVFLGKISLEAVVEVLKGAHVYVSTPSTEGVSASLLEAMAAACIPVVTDLPGNRDWITDLENGFLVAQGDAEAVARALATIWREPEVWKARAWKNVEKIREKADIEKNMNRFVQEYRRLVAARAPKADR